jgi:hypothetical protein
VKTHSRLSLKHLTHELESGEISHFALVCRHRIYAKESLLAAMSYIISDPKRDCAHSRRPACIETKRATHTSHVTPLILTLGISRTIADLWRSLERCGCRRHCDPFCLGFAIRPRTSLILGRLHLRTVCAAETLRRPPCPETIRIVWIIAKLGNVSGERKRFG